MKIVSKTLDYYHTLRHVTPVQFLYRVKYGLKRISSLKIIRFDGDSVEPLSMLSLPLGEKCAEILDSGIKMKFLNLSRVYPARIDWADQQQGRLWNYHLQYASFLNQHDFSVQFRKGLILNLYQWLSYGKLKPEPYPASLRIMNVIRFLSTNYQELKEETELVDFLHSELHYLEYRLEYQLLGNHLMQNAFALLMGGMFFKNRNWITVAEHILKEQVPEQTLTDGAHFERSPMYHLILLFRYLEAMYYLPKNSDLSSLFKDTAKKMLAWIQNMSFRNGMLAHFNDSTDQQSYTKDEIFELAEKCGILEVPSVELSESGFKKFENHNFELLIDAAGIEPAVQPGHSHADSLSFLLHVQGKPVITDPGISTYETGPRRNQERSTRAHNTVTFQGQNTAEVWSRFRVGRRPEVAVEDESTSGIVIRLRHRLKSGEIFEHRRNFTVTSEFIEVKDHVNLDKPVEGRLCLDPGLSVKMITPKTAELSNGIVIRFSDVRQVQQFSYDYCRGFNFREKANGIVYTFMDHCSFQIIAPKP